MTHRSRMVGKRPCQVRPLLLLLLLRFCCCCSRTEALLEPVEELLEPVEELELSCWVGESSAAICSRHNRLMPTLLHLEPRQRELRRRVMLLSEPEMSSGYRISSPRPEPA